MCRLISNFKERSRLLHVFIILSFVISSVRFNELLTQPHILLLCVNIIYKIVTDLDFFENIKPSIVLKPDH